MTENITVKSFEPKAEEAMLLPTKPNGWLLFIKYPTTTAWSFGTPDYEPNRDNITHPYPLFKSKDQAMSHARKALTHGGEVKLFKIEL